MLPIFAAAKRLSCRAAFPVLAKQMADGTAFPALARQTLESAQAAVPGTKILVAWLALAAGFATAGGFIAFITLIGIVTRLAGITKTAESIPLYENSLALGILLFNLFSLYQPSLVGIPPIAAKILLDICGLFIGIFVGCLAGAVAEVVNIIPIFSRRVHLRKGFPYMVRAAAVGKCVGCLLQFYIFSK